jgi:hypothetical protein
MIVPRRRGFLLVLVLLTAASAFGHSAPNAAVTDPAAAQAKKDHLRKAEKQIDQRSSQTTGIQVGEPKVYDDSLLQQMLSAARARLASLQVLDQTGIAGHLGSVTGTTQSISSFSLSAQGPTLPQVATTNTGATNSTVSGTSNTTTRGATPGTSDTTNSQTTAAAPTSSSTTTTPQISPPTATLPAPSTSLLSTFGVSASDLLGEQMQLTYEIANLQLLLGGSLSDWTIGTSKIVKPRVTLGFPITIDPDKRAKDATAVVEIEVEKDSVQPFSPTSPLRSLPCYPARRPTTSPRSQTRAWQSALGSRHRPSPWPEHTGTARRLTIW